MATRAPTGFDIDRLHSAVLSTYERVASHPFGPFHFHRGAVFASQMLGYDASELAQLPRVATDRFAGVGNPGAIGPIELNETVLDHACGAGTDLLLAAKRVGPAGRVIGVDMTPGMRNAAQLAAERAGLSERVSILAGRYEDLPVESGSVDVVLSNGVLNLAPDKEKVLREVFRVLRPGGRLYLADVVVKRELSLEARENPELWAACIAGALPEGELHELSCAVGLVDTRVAARFDCFAGTTAEEKVSRDLQVNAVNFFARKPSVS